MGAALAVTFVCTLAPAITQGASVGSLQTKVDAAKAQAQSLAADIQATKSQMFETQARAAAAASKEKRLSGLLVSGRERAAKLSDEVEASERRLKRERARLARARDALAARLVAIYKTGEPDAASLALGSSDFEDLLTRTDYVAAIQDADNALAFRVEEVGNQVKATLTQTTKLRDRARAHNARLEGARSEIATVRGDADAEAANLAAVSAESADQISTLQTSIGGWVDDIAAAKAAAAKRAAADAADEASAQQEVDAFFGGPYSIPTYIVMCESGGNYHAVNPSSGAGGAYQILPSTWEAYGGQGLPQDASKAEQDRIAALIYADSGSSPWVCG